MNTGQQVNPLSHTEQISIGSLLSLTLPAALSAMLNNAYRVIDQQAVQWLGVDAQAAIASCSFVLIGFFAIYSIFSSGALALVSRAAGRGEHAAQRALASEALAGALLTGIIVLSLSAGLSRWTASTLGLTGNVADQAGSFLRWHAMTCLPQALMPTVDAIFIACGRTKVVFGLQIISCALNFLLNPVFIYRLHLGIGGAAAASGVSQAAALLIGLILLASKNKLVFKPLQSNKYLDKIIRIGLPVCWGTLVFSAVYWALLRWVISPLGPAVNAALGIGFSVLEGFTWPVFWGFSMGIASIVGRSLGAGKVERADLAVKLAVKMVAICGLLAAVLFWVLGRAASALFTTDPSVLEQAAAYAEILAISQLFVAYEALAEGILTGAGKTKTVFYWSAPLNILRIPFAWLFAIDYGYGPAAVWWVINISTILKTLGKWSAVLSGRWRD